VLDIFDLEWHFAGMSLNKLEKLKQIIGSCGSCIVAYSGGVDSVFLAFVAHQVLGEKSLAVLADSPSLPRREFNEAIEIAKKFSFRLQIIRTAELSNSDYAANPENRCYFCKHELFSELLPIARKENAAAIFYGENASDQGDYRPGIEAARKFQARAPLKEAGLTKPEIRALSAQFGLPTADKPQMACLSSRIPYGEPVTEKKLSMIEQAEYLLRDLGFYQVRVRLHEFSSNGTKASMARIELGQNEIPRLLADGLLNQVSGALTKLGFAYVTLDLAGYRRGTFNPEPVKTVEPEG
jgi:uncharacterized protein